MGLGYGNRGREAEASLPIATNQNTASFLQDTIENES